MTFTVGSLVCARDREWVVLPGSTAEALLVRPMGGSEDEATGIIPDIEPVTAARFDPQMGRFVSKLIAAWSR